MVSHHSDHSLFDSNIATMLRAVTCVMILYVEWSKGGVGVGSPGTGVACEKGLWWGVAQKETDHSGREVGGMAPAAQGCPGCAGRLLCKHDTLRLGAEWSKSKARDDGGQGQETEEPGK